MVRKEVDEITQSEDKQNMPPPKKKAAKPEGEERDPDSLDPNNKTRSVHLGDAEWEKMKLMRDSVGTWNQFANITTEQLLASGLVKKEIREAIYRINKENGIDFLEDSGWRTTFGIREPWSGTAANIKKMREELAEIKSAIEEMELVVENHATTMLSAQLVEEDPS